MFRYQMSAGWSLIAVFAITVSLFSANPARADTIVTNILSNATISGGATVTGTWYIDQSKYSYTNQTGFVSGDITISGGTPSAVDGTYAFDHFDTNLTAFTNTSSYQPLLPTVFPTVSDPVVTTTLKGSGAIILENGFTNTFTFTSGSLISYVPAPSSLSVLASGLLGFGLLRRRRKLHRRT